MRRASNWPLTIIGLHWLMALLIVGLYILGDYMVDLDYYDPWYQSAPFWHKSFGLLVGLLLVLRIGVRLFSRSPEGNDVSRFNKLAAVAVHSALYGLVLLICISGFLISSADGRVVSFFGLFDVASLGALIDKQEDVAGVWHERAGLAILFLAGFHALAALKHHFIDGDRVLKRMIGLDK